MAHVSDDSDPDDPGAAERADRPERFVIDEERADQRVDQAVAELTGTSRSQAGRWIKDGHVELAGEPCTRASRKVRIGDILDVDRPEPEAWDVAPEAIPLDIVFEDEHLVVVDKPAGLVVHPAPGHRTGTLVNALLHHCHDLAGVGDALRPGIVHRLDQGTTGILVVAKDDATHRGLAAQFEDHSIERVYRAIARGAPKSTEGRVDQPIGRHPGDRKRMSVRARSGRRAVTNWRVIERFGTSHHAWLELRPETGRTHQIRVHLASIGLPLAGDRVYGRARAKSAGGLPTLERPALHAASLGFVHPARGERLHFESPLPADLEALLAALRAREAGS
jgi:23S rRNA pseudouridine1911/1915/1917 synthase